MNHTLQKVHFMVWELEPNLLKEVQSRGGRGDGANGGPAGRGPSVHEARHPEGAQPDPELGRGSGRTCSHLGARGSGTQFLAYRPP